MRRMALLGLAAVLAVFGLVLLVLPGPPSSAPPSPSEKRQVVVLHEEEDDLPGSDPSPIFETRQALADAGGMGRIECRLLDGQENATATGLHRARRHAGVLAALVRDPEGNAPLRARNDDGDVVRVGHLRWSDAFPGEQGVCVAEPARRALEHLVRVVEDGDVLDRVPAARLLVRGCESVDPADDDGVFRIVSLQDTPCMLKVVDPATGRYGEHLVDAHEDLDFDLLLDDERPELAGRSALEVRQDRFAAQLVRAEEWVGIYEAALSEPLTDSAREHLEQELAALHDDVEALERLVLDE